MKKSNILLFTALFLLIGFLATFNLALLAEYRKGNYKDPYAQFNALNIQDFNTVDVNAASKLSVKVMAGPYQVRVFDNIAKYIKVTQEGSTLKIDLDLPENVRIYGPPYHVVISCPELKSLRTHATYTVGGKQVTDKNKIPPFLNYNTAVQGFTQDSLFLQQDNAGIVNLTDNKIKTLKAVVGISPGSTNTLTISKGNILESAKLDMRHKSELLLNDVQIPEFTYQFGDSTKVTCSGASLGMIKTNNK